MRSVADRLKQNFGLGPPNSRLFWQHPLGGLSKKREGKSQEKSRSIIQFSESLGRNDFFSA